MSAAAFSSADDVTMSTAPATGAGAASASPFARAVESVSVPVDAPMAGAGAVSEATEHVSEAIVVPITEDAKEPGIWVFTANNELRFIRKELVNKSGLLARLLEDMEAGACKQTEATPIVPVTSKTLDKVLAFCEHNLKNEVPEFSKPFTDSRDFEKAFDKWYITFSDVEVSELYALLEAANFLEVKPMCEVIGAKLASLIIGLSTEQIRERFGLINDHTPEEEAELRKIGARILGTSA